MFQFEFSPKSQLRKITFCIVYLEIIWLYYYYFFFSISAKHEKIKDEDGMEIKTENEEFKLPRKERTYTCEQCEQTFPR